MKSTSIESKSNGSATQWLLGVGLGAWLMYMLDPDRGRRRRALMRDRMLHAAHVFGDSARVAARDTGHRVQGLWAMARGKVQPEGASDEVLALRVKAAIGRVVSHPRSIAVAVDNGRVTLSGPILALEVEDLLSCVAEVRGAREVDNQLTVHESADHVPALQGGPPRADRFELMQNNWPPAARVLTSVIGGALVVHGLGRRSPFGLVIAAAGAGLLVRSATNRPVGSLVGLHGQRRPIFVRKTIVIDAPVDRVFAFWNQPENFPRFMKNVRRVTALGGNRSRWVVAGPAGTLIEWTAEVTEMVGNELISWRSERGSTVQQWGTIRFSRSNGNGGTRLDIMLAYSPPAGDLGHGVAKLFGADPESEMETDLTRMKQMIETGQPMPEIAQPASPGPESQRMGQPVGQPTPPRDLEGGPRNLP